MTIAAAVKERPILFRGPMVRGLQSDIKTKTRRIVKPQPSEADWDTCRANLGGDTHKAYPWVHPEFGLGLRRDALLPDAGVGFPDPNIQCPYGRPGDRLWVRETYAIVPRTAYHHAASEIPHRVSPDGDSWAVYREGWTRCAPEPWKPSIHMPRWASRIVLEITDVRVERVQAISEDDARAEGVERNAHLDGSWSENDGFLDYANLKWCGGEGFPAPTARWSFMTLWAVINGVESWRANPLVWVLSFKRVLA